MEFVQDSKAIVRDLPLCIKIKRSRIWSVAMTPLPPRPTPLPPPPYPQPPPSQPIQLSHPYIPSLPPTPLPTCHPYNPYHPPLPFGPLLPLTPPHFFWPTFGQGPQPPICSLPVPNVSHPSTLQSKPTITLSQLPKPQQPKPKPQLGEIERISTFFRINSKVFSLAFDGGRIDSYAIHERRGKFHGSIRVGHLGLDWFIACLADLD